MSKALMIQGTGSGVGKSVIVAGLCKIFSDMGIRVAPFKAQNMALNSFITKEGGEIGRAQAFQAEAAGIEPCNDINPILLKAMSDSGCQVILDGKVYANMKATDYYAIKDKAWEAVTAAYDRLSEKYDLIVIEGAGSPAEINLQEEEIVNMRVARYANAPVILVGDIDKGGVFASLYGTIELLNESSNGLNKPEKSDADYIKAFIVNKFRGDVEILRPGLRMIENKTGRPVIGVVNYFGDLGLHEEDGLPIERFKQFNKSNQFKPLKIVILRLRYISNFTDFDPFMYEPDVELKYSLRREDINSADLIIIPGSKNTVSDLLFLRENGIEEILKLAIKSRTPLIGICGGYQMLGEKILDPYNLESSMKEVNGIGLLNIITTLDKVKTTCQLSAEIINTDVFKWFQIPPSSSKNSLSRNAWTNNLSGYEIHMGVTTGDVGLFKINRYQSKEQRTQNTDKSPPTHPSPSRGEGKGGGENLGSVLCALGSEVLDGSSKGNVWGTYIHGLFDNNSFRTALLNSLREKKGLSLRKETINYHAQKEKAIVKWADILRNNIDICFILSRLIGMDMEYCKSYLVKDKK